MEEKKGVIVRIEALGFEEGGRDAFRKGLSSEIRKKYPSLLEEKKVFLFFSDGLLVDFNGRKLRSIKVSSTDSALTASNIKRVIMEIDPNIDVFECSIRC